MRPEEITLDNIDNIDFSILDLSFTPESEKWLYQNKEALRSVLTGLEQSKNGLLRKRGK